MSAQLNLEVLQELKPYILILASSPKYVKAVKLPANYFKN